MSGPSLLEWFIAARPKTLTASIIPVIIAHLIIDSYSSEHVSIALSSLCLFCALLIQTGTNFFNDVVDFKSGVDSENRTGPKRLLQQGKVSENRLRAAAHSCFILALIIGLPLVLKGGLAILIIGLTSVLIGYSYSAPPLKLAYRGLAEPFVIIFFGIIATIGVELLHTRSFTRLGLLTGLQFGLLATVLMVINNIRDCEQDKKNNKKTPVARFGRRFGIYEVIMIYVATGSISLIPTIYMLPMGYLNFLWLIPSLLVIYELLVNFEKRDLNKTLAKAALAHLALGLSRAIQIIFI